MVAQREPGGPQKGYLRVRHHEHQWVRIQNHAEPTEIRHGTQRLGGVVQLAYIDDCGHGSSVRRHAWTMLDDCVKDIQEHSSQIDHRRKQEGATNKMSFVNLPEHTKGDATAKVKAHGTEGALEAPRYGAWNTRV